MGSSAHKPTTHMHSWRDQFQGLLVDMELGRFCLVGRVGHPLHDMPHDVRHHRLWTKQAGAAFEAHLLLVLLLLFLQGAMCQRHVGAQQRQCDKALLAQGAHEAGEEAFSLVRVGHASPSPGHHHQKLGQHPSLLPTTMTKLWHMMLRDVRDNNGSVHLVF